MKTPSRELEKEESKVFTGLDSKTRSSLGNKASSGINLPFIAPSEAKLLT